MMPTLAQKRRWIGTFIVSSLVLFTYIFMNGVVFAQTPVEGFGIGRGQGQETGINLDALNKVRTDINSGMYDRACTPAEHDPTKWHSLVNVEKKCHYDHQHNDDPNYVNDIFGPPGAWFGASGQSISYPWQTFKAATALEGNASYIAAHQMENDLKHEGYVWVVRRDQACPTGNCVTDFRLEVHALMGAADMPVRYHSYTLEARVCINSSNPSSCGIVRYGGWADTGRLFTTPPDVVSCLHSVQEIFIPLPADTQYFPIDRPASRDEIRCHPNLAHLPATTGGKPLAEWWGHAGGETRFQLRSYDPIGNVDAADPTKWHFHCSPTDTKCQFDGSIFSAFIGYTLQIPSNFGQVNGRTVPVDANNDGRTDFKGYFTRWGKLNPTCTAPGLDCVPYEYNNVVLNFQNNKEARYVQTTCDNCARTDYNISPPGKDWITWFFTKYGGVVTPVPPTPAPGTPLPSTPVPSTPVPSTPVPATPVIPTGPALIVYVTPANANVNGKVDVQIGVANVTDLYAMQTQCIVTPGVLVGAMRSDGDIFKNGTSFFIDRGFNASNGQWTIAASKLKPNPSFTGNGLAYKMTFNVKGAGTSAVNCTVIAVNSKGQKINLTVVNGMFNGPVVNNVVVTPVLLQPTVVPTAIPTIVPTDVPLILPTDVQVAPESMSSISGVMTVQNEADSSGITVQLVTADVVLATVTTGPDGSYTFTDVPTGTYGVTAAAPQHIRIGKVVNVPANGQVISVEALELPGGDADNNGTVDLSDASLVGANLDAPAAAAVPQADLNGDGVIDILDLAMIGGNFGLVGPIVK